MGTPFSKGFCPERILNSEFLTINMLKMAVAMDGTMV